MSVIHQQQIQQNVTVYKVFPNISSVLITDQDPLLEVLCVNIRHVYDNTLLLQFPTDDNDQEKRRKQEREEKKGEEGREKKKK